MKLNTRTKSVLFISIIVLLLSAGACFFFTWQIISKGTQLDEFIKVLNVKNEQDASHNRVRKLVYETNEKRTQMAQAFFEDESESISFLGQIETFASTIGIDLKTEGLNKKTFEDTKTEYIEINFVYTGQRERVLDFTKLLENTLYHSNLESFEFHKKSDGLWEGKADLHITIKPK